MRGRHLFDLSGALWFPVLLLFQIGGLPVSAHAGSSGAPVLVSSSVPASAPIGAVTSSLSATVLNGKTLAFHTGYSSLDWSGVLDAFKLASDGTQGDLAWSVGARLDALAPANRVILTARFNVDGSFGHGLEFRAFDNLDTAAQGLVMTPASMDSTYDTGQTRIDWLRGDRASEANGTMRRRSTLLGAIIRSQALYVSHPAAGYRNVWPPLANGTTAPETVAAATPAMGTDYVSYERFSIDQADRTPVVYVGANDGMLHAFDATQNIDGSNTATSGRELWAYVPRSAYANLGNLTSRASFTFTPTVDATPVTRDVFFDASTTMPAKTSAGWHTLLVGSLGGGGRGVFALDVTDPNPADANGVNVANTGSKVLWEFNADMPVVASSSNGAGGTDPGGDPADLGYTFGQPNIGRLANGKWVVLVPGGYSPDCSKSDQPIRCSSGNVPSADGAPAVSYSALFLLDAQTGALIDELKTPTDITGVASNGLSSPVLGDYNNDQVDDVAFAGDLAGNVWRYDLTSPDPSRWSVRLAYQPTTQGMQPITVMPRLFPDPATHRFIVVFGTGKYLAMDGSHARGVQSVYGIRDLDDTVYGTARLVQQMLTELNSGSVHCGETYRGLTNYPVPANRAGWYFNLIAPDEQVVVTPGALFDTNRAVVTTLIPDNDGCSTGNEGAVMIVDAATGGADDGLSMGPANWASSVSRYKAVGGRVNNLPTGGMLPVATIIGGGKLVFPGIALNSGGVLAGNDVIWRRRSWRELNTDQ
ncbi:PilC/PilY family type IV pilus protein [Rhodanobacter sp. C03]|uniref:pilus assembly protein n=1 Tax=Rhodanobacter sp. C03 TaxID=1945858 RepID=UPI0009D05A99|nr:PilC/PilY family type IV pilus protein [Rhodanobacter sp. C03]OOG57264.1 hypothetical protein B0E48_07320 [Rhodanobacter sp. C03]